MSNGSLSIRVQNLTKTFSKHEALSNVSLHFEKASMHGIIGPEGSGKTTLMRLLIQLLNPTSGSVEYLQNDQVVSFENIRDSIAYMPQSQSLYPDLSIQEHLEFFRDLYGVSKEKYDELITELLEVTRLKPFLKRSANQLSGGMYKKLGLMCALLRSPKIILLDEPTNGVDPISRREFWDLLYKLSDQKILILMTTSYMDEAERCTHVKLLDNGKVLASGEPQTLLKEANVQTFDEYFIQKTESAEKELLKDN